MDKAVKISIIVGALIVGLSIAYYLVFYIPKRDASRIEQKKEDRFREECIEEKKGMRKQFSDALFDCTNDKCRENIMSGPLVPSDDYLQTCLDRKRLGLPTFGY